MMLRLAPADWIIVALYFSVLLFLGLRKNKTAQSKGTDFVLGGRMLTLPSFVAALVSTWYGGILGVGEFSYSYGISNWIVFGVPYYFFAIIFALYFAPKIRRAEVTSIPDTLYRHFDRKTGLIGSLLTFFITSPAPYILMVTILLQVVTGFSFGVSLFASTVGSAIYVMTGGFRSVVQTEKLQFALMFSGFLIMAILLVSQRGFAPIHPDALPTTHWLVTGGNSWQYILTWFFIALWTLVAPTFHQFTNAAKDVRTARNGILISVACWIFFDLLTTIAGMYARGLLPHSENPSMAYPALAESFLPPVAKGIFYIGMLATVISTVDGFTFIAATTIGQDVIGKLSGKNDSASITRYVRIGILVTIAISFAIILLFPSIINLWYIIGSLCIPGLLLPLVSCYWTKWKLSPTQTFNAMIVGSALSLASFIWGMTHQQNGIALYPFGIEPMYPGLAGVGVMWMVGKGRGKWI